MPPFPTGLELAIGAPCGRLSSSGTTSRRERVFRRPFGDGRSLELEPVDQEKSGGSGFHVFHGGNEVQDVAAGLARKAVVGVLLEADSELSRTMASVDRAGALEAVASPGQVG